MASAARNVEKSTSVENDDEEFRPEEMEYETQLFEFTPKSFVDSLYNQVFQTLERKLEKLKSDILEKYGAALSADEMEAVFMNITTEMVRLMNFRFSKFEGYALQNVFFIPPYVCLPEDEIKMDPRLAEARKTELDAEIRELQKRAYKAHFMNEQMLGELQIIKTVQGIQAEALTRLKQASDVGKTLAPQRHEQEKNLKTLAAFLSNNSGIEDDETSD